MAVFRRLPGLVGLGWPWLAVVLVFMLAFIGHVLESRALAFCVSETDVLDLRCSEMLLEGVDMIGYGVVFDLAGVVSLLFISGLLL